MHPRRNRYLTILVAVGMTAFAMTPVAGREDSTAEPVAADNLIQRDAALYADEYDVSVEEAERRLAAQDALSASLDAARKAAGAQFAGMGIEHDPDYRGVVRIVGSVPGDAQLLEIAAGSPVAVTVESGAKYSYDDLVSAQRRLDGFLAQHQPDAAHGLDLRAGSLYVSTAARLDASSLEAMGEVAGVPVIGRMGDPFRLLHTYGGRRIHSTSAANECTTGFTVRHSATQVRGVTTAGHCGNTGLTYYQSNPSISYPMTFMGQRYDDDQDFQWAHESTHAVYPRFWDGSAYRIVTDGIPPNHGSMVGHVVCHYGITTAMSCGTIVGDSFDPGNICGPDGQSNCYGQWVRVVNGNDTMKCWGGDSGGPWWRVGTGSAYGTLQAGKTTGPNPGQCDEATFMSIHFLNLESLYVIEG